MPKKYRISHKSLRTMGLSDETMEEMIQKGIAEPSPIDRKRSAIPKRLSKQHQADAMDILSAIDDLNEDLMEAGTPVRLVVQIRTIAKPAPTLDLTPGSNQEADAKEER